ncbi:ABC transporter permease [soil metagenome]
MTTFVMRRLLQLFPTLIGVSLLTFFIMRMGPGDPVRTMLGAEADPAVMELKRKELGFDKPLSVQYLIYMGVMPKAEQDGWKPIISQYRVTVFGRDYDVRSFSYWQGVVEGNLGTSIISKDTVWLEIRRRLPATFELAALSMFFAMLTGITIGVLSAVYPRSFLDSATRLFVFVFLAMPSFWLGLELIMHFARGLEWFPPAGRGDPWVPEALARHGFNMNLHHMLLPAVTLGVGTGAFLCRILRSSMLQVLGQDYIRTARAKGLDRKRVVMKHALKNAMIPFITVAGLSMGSLLGGSVIVESVFNWPGVGKYFVESILQRDFPVTMGCVLLLAGLIVLINLAVDLLYVVLDPRVRLDGKGT